MTTITRPSNAEYRTMLYRITAGDLEAFRAEEANRVSLHLQSFLDRLAFPSHDDVFSATEIAASFDGPESFDGWAEIE